MNADSAAPLVSVLLASRNGARFLPEALASIASQTYPAIEPVLVDDGSSDGTRAILDEFAASHPRARVLRADGVGLASALALAAREATGPTSRGTMTTTARTPSASRGRWITWKRIPKSRCLGTAAHMIDVEGRRIGTHPVPLTSEEIGRTLRRAAPFVHGSVVMRRGAYEAAGGYRGAFRASQDYDLWLRMAPHAGLANLPDPLYEWRLHDAGVFSRARRDQLFYAAVARGFADERRDAGSDSISLLANGADPEGFLTRYPRAGRLALYLGEVHVREGLGREGRRYLGRALRESEFGALPWWLLAWLIPWTPRGAGPRAALAREDPPHRGCRSLEAGRPRDARARALGETTSEGPRRRPLGARDPECRARARALALRHPPSQHDGLAAERGSRSPCGHDAPLLRGRQDGRLRAPWPLEDAREAG
jgi:hypothetical protein